MNRDNYKINKSGRFVIRFVIVDILLIPMSLIGAFLLRFDFMIPKEVFVLLTHYIHNPLYQFLSVLLYGLHFYLNSQLI